MRFLVLATLTTLTTLAACGGAEPPVDTLVTAGDACVDSGIATVTYTFDTCMSSMALPAAGVRQSCDWRVTMSTG